jgi:TolB-like protein
VPGAWRVLALVSALLAVACGYYLSGSGTLPKNVRVVTILPFENRTGRPEIEQRVTEELARALSARGPYKVVANPTDADAVLEGAVTRYETTPVQFTDAGRASRVEASVTVQASLRDRSNDEILWSQSGLIFRGQYNVPEAGQFFDQESVSMDEIARGAAEAVITSIFEGF